MRLSGAAAATILACLTVACGSGSGGASTVARASSNAAVSGHTSLVLGQWRVAVTVAPRRLGPIGVRVDHLTVAPQAGFPKPWIRHDLVLTNESARPILVSATRTLASLAGTRHPKLLVSDHGCSYVSDGPRSPVQPACVADLPGLTVVAPHTSTVTEITLWEGLPDMAPLTAGTYVFRQPVRLQLGNGRVGSRSTVVTLVYSLQAR